MTPLKLQKMVFYADAWFMALNDGEELIADRFEAWVHEPVARDLYIRFANYKLGVCYILNTNIKYK